jgi:hypothetical protein
MQFCEPGGSYSTLTNVRVSCFSTASRTEILSELQSLSTDKRKLSSSNQARLVSQAICLPGGVFGNSKLLTVESVRGLISKE